MPNCHQCTRKNQQCPGYVRTLKWSSKYEKHKLYFDTESSSKEKGQGRVFVGSRERPKPLTEPHLQETADANVDAIPEPFFPLSPILLEDLELATTVNNLRESNLVDEFSPPRGIGDTASSLSSISVDLIPSVPLDLDTVSDHTGYIYPFISRIPWPASPTSDLVLCSPSLAIHSFSQIICRNLCTCDSKPNPIRSVSVSKVRTSLLYHSLLRYTTAAYLAKGRNSSPFQFLIQEAQIDTLFYLESEIERVIKGEREPLFDALLAIIMYGLTVSWDGSNYTGIQHYEAAVSLYNQEPKGSPQSQYFFGETLAYWWCGLSFVTNTDVDTLSPPPLFDPNQSGMFNDKRFVHPLTGICPRAHLLLGKVGSLLHVQRARALSLPFTSKKLLKEEGDALEQAQSLEEQLLSLQIPDIDNIADTQDENTSVEDLRNMAEALRLAALLLLYRGYQDLLQERITVSAGKGPANIWLVSLSFHILDLLSRNGPSSGTRSVEQIVLVIVAGELRMPEDLSSPFAADKHDNIQAAPPYAQTCLTGGDEIFGSSASFFMSSIAIENHYPNSGSIRTARSQLLGRLAAVRSILPYRSVEQVEDLILEIWKRSDAGEDVFWMDVMIHNGWKFVMA